MNNLTRNQFFQRFCISRVDRSVRSGDVHVFVHKMEGTDLKEVGSCLVPAISAEFSHTKDILHVEHSTLRRR